MVFLEVLFCVFLFPLTSSSDRSICFADYSLLPTNPASLNDASSDTCTSFQQKDVNSSRGFTQFRIKARVAEVGHINVTITGNSLGCGRNLYVSPLSITESESWLGRWTRFKVANRTGNDNTERCSYWFSSTGPMNEIQVIRTPLSSDHAKWKICHINITTKSSVYFGCSEVLDSQSGVYRIRLPNTDNYTEVYCDQETNGGGWTVLMRRMDGSENFTREWDDYKEGFGNFYGEFWAGNEFMHKLTNDGKRYLLRVELESYEGEFVYAEYSKFSIGSESDYYTLHVSGYLNQSTAGDSMLYHNGMKFSSPSRDNDSDNKRNCCVHYSGSWWYKYCYTAHLTANYGKDVPFGMGISWRSKWGSGKFARFARMMTRPLK